MFLRVRKAQAYDYDVFKQDWMAGSKSSEQFSQYELLVIPVISLLSINRK